VYESSQIPVAPIVHTRPPSAKLRSDDRVHSVQHCMLQVEISTSACMYDSIVHCESAITRTQLRSNSFYPTPSRPTLAPHMVLTPERPWCQTCTCSTISRGINHYVTRGPRRHEHYFGVISSKIQHHRGTRAVRMGARPGLITNPWIESLSLRAPTAPVSAIPINFHIHRERQRDMPCVYSLTPCHHAERLVNLEHAWSL
jgi:hypothetical protein